MTHCTHEAGTAHCHELCLSHTETKYMTYTLAKMYYAEQMTTTYEYYLHTKCKGAGMCDGSV